MVAGLFGGVAVGLGVPVLGQLLDGGYVNDAVVQVLNNLRHVASQEVFVVTNTVSGQQGAALLGH